MPLVAIKYNQLHLLSEISTRLSQHQMNLFYSSFHLVQIQAQSYKILLSLLLEDKTSMN